MGHGFIGLEMWGTFHLGEMIKIKYHSTDLSTTSFHQYLRFNKKRKLCKTANYSAFHAAVTWYEASRAFIHLSLCNHSQLQPQLVWFTLLYDNTCLSSQCTIRVQTSIQQLLLFKIIVSFWSLNLWLKGTQHLRCHNNGNINSCKGQTEAKGEPWIKQIRKKTINQPQN